MRATSSVLKSVELTEFLQGGGCVGSGEEVVWVREGGFGVDPSVHIMMKQFKGPLAKT